MLPKLHVFNQVTLDGYFSGPNGDLSWAHKQDPEWDKFVAGNAQGGGTLLFGRVTYEMMAAFWPTPEAAKAFPAVAEGMNNAQKIVFSYRPAGTDFYHLYEINTDGAGLKQLTRGEFDDYEPAYLPDGDMVFVSTRCKRWAKFTWT